MNEEATRVSQHFGVLTTGFSSCASEERSADGLRNQSQELLADMMTRWIVLERELLPAFGRFACESCCQLVKRYGVVLISWNGVVLEYFVAIAFLVVAADVNERKESNAIVGVVTTGFECLPPSCDGLTGPDDHGPMISRLIDRGTTGNQAGPSGSSAGRSPRP
ncbi:hypothetical protein F511_33970 [Dorcoceras hygrometricum]|uniref:Uncharacterized protein n=1 Tax=Dorcoceras hygrometricum TaxID=472368 RepID=A0A2Z7BXP6_9LAMI|nr:hypothetical protein F511_33970 [Dorcoceras hygrometricum]